MKKFKIVKKFIVLTMLIFSACSSAPKNPGDIYKLRNQVEDGMKTANNFASQGNYEHALNLITEYKRMAVLADDPSLIIRSCLSRGNILLSMNMTNEAFIEWDYAINEAARIKDGELLSVSKIYKARGSLLSGRTEARSVLEEVNQESANIKKDALFIAFSWQIKGLTLRALGSFKEAEDAMKQSLVIHEKKRSLENVSYDWYTIASIRSLAGNNSGALQALEESIKVDRRIENSWGLAASWRAMGDVYRNSGREKDALEAYKRARDIYTAMKNEQEAAEIGKKLEIKE